MRVKKYSFGIMLGLGVWATAYALAPSSNIAPRCSASMPPTVALPHFKTLLANAHGNKLANRMASAQVLGWLNAPVLCGGYFAGPYIPGTAENLPSPANLPVTISAGDGLLRYRGTSQLAGPIVISQAGRIITADQGNITSDAGTFKQAELIGSVLLRETGKVIAGHAAWINLQNKNFRMDNVIYRMFLTHDAPQESSTTHLSAWGNAKNITRQTSGKIHLQQVSYSTCPPQSRAWGLEAQQLDLDQSSGRGRAYHAVLYVQSLPIFYAPYFNFPIDNRRHTGFLYPQFNFGSTSGFGLGTPFYWNIAPNQDDTIIPYFYTKRGVAFNNTYRYLTEKSHGAINFMVLPNDWEFRRFQQTEQQDFPLSTPGMPDLINANATRNFINVQHDTQFTPQWVGNIYYSRVSDDYYLQDFGGVSTVAQNQLLQRGQLHYLGDDWRFLANFQAFQTLHPVNEAVVLNQYSMLPQLLFTSHLPLRPNAFNYQWQAEIVHFLEAPNPGQSTTPPEGERFRFVPALSLPLSNAAGYITPRIEWNMTQYMLAHQPNTFSQQITRILPVADIDSGLFLLRNFTWQQRDYQQTLEPRLFYLWAPYHDQHDIPVFDSALPPFSYDALFSTNRFNGSDRIGDANQISIALTTRILDQTTGEQKISASLGIIRYFTQRRVTLCSTVGCVDSPYSVGSTSTTDTLSPIVGKAQYNFSPAWNGSLHFAWGPNNGQTQNTLLNMQYKLDNNHIVNVGYNYIRYGDFYTLPVDENSQALSLTTPATIQVPDKKYNLSQPTFSLVWPLNEKWQVLGSWSYSWNQHHALTYFAGASYNSCCWGMQMVVAKSFNGFNPTGQPQFNTGVYVQFAFKGLAKVAANDPTTLLLANIPGYQDNFGMV